MTAAALRLDARTATRFAHMVLDNVRREYPSHITHLLNSDADALPPRTLHPAFYGSYDWHSAVHSHWLLARLLRLFPQADFSAEIDALLERHLTRRNIMAERHYFESPHRAGFERPYGLAWLLQLDAELAEWGTSQTLGWRAVLAPLVELVVSRFAGWLPKLSHPVRGGEHSQTAFALGLVRDWAQTTGNANLASLMESRSRDFYLRDVNAPLAYEPSGHDFLSPALAEADLMRRVLPQREFINWLGKFLPQIPDEERDAWLQPAMSRDPSDGKLAHLDGLNLSRAWMLEGIADALPVNDGRRAVLLATARVHGETGLAAVTAEQYEGSHWLPSFAVYLLTRRGLAPHG
ncbi:MAG: DUF2891 domain-containing protein [Gammaproteobacteria bacterium]